MENAKKRVDIWSVLVYLILYSIAGFLIETIFGMLTKGVIESRKSFLYGPFCAIYGIGAISMIAFLKNEKDNKKLFLKGAVIGATVEYAMSFLCEKWFGVKWWDYSNMWLNIQGRTCLFYAVSWGLLAIVLIKYVNPHMDEIIKTLKEKNHIFKAGILLVIAFFAVDATITGYALKAFYYRISLENNLDIGNQKIVQSKFAKIETNEKLMGFINEYYTDEKMIKNYPNIMIGQTYVESLVDGVKSYYYRLGDAK